MEAGQPVRVSVVVPVHNSAATLARAVESATAQTLREIEVLVIDDKSTDDSLGVARRLAAADPRIRVVALPKNGGKARAMNLAAAEIARGEWVAVLDADDRYLPTRLAKLVAAGEANDVDLVADNQLHLDDATGQVVRQAFAAPGAGRGIGLQDFIAHSDTSATFDFGILKPMVRRAFLERTNLAYHPEARLAEDYYFLMEFFVAGGRGWLVHEPLYQWTLPFSPTARRWTSTGSGAWRYDYRNALVVNRSMRTKLGSTAPAALDALLRRREREYRVMVHYLDAQRAMADAGDVRKALAIIATHPTTWPLLAKRVVGRVARRIGAGRP